MTTNLSKHSSQQFPEIRSDKAYMFKYSNMRSIISPLSTKLTKWLNTLKQTIFRQQLANCLSVFDHFMVLALKGD